MEKEDITSMDIKSENKNKNIEVDSENSKVEINPISVNEEVLNQDELGEDVKTEDLVVINQIPKVINDASKVKDETTILSETTKDHNLNNKFFFTEVMATAGPRKNFQEDARKGDYDLGEDVAGCFVRKNKSFFWLLDGTSDNPIFQTTDYKEIVSSRILSQDVAWNIQRIIWDKNPIVSSDKVLRECFNSIIEDWQKKLDGLNEIDKVRLFEILSEKTSITVSTTVIFGSIDINGTLDVSQIGDSFIVTNPTNKFSDLKGRFFVVVRANSDKTQFEVVHNPFEDTRCQTFTMENINTVVLATDGISSNTIKWLQLKPANFTDPVFRKTISAIKHGTCDDKALCVIQILSDD